MGLPLVIAEALSTQSVRQIVTGITATVVGGAIGKTFDDTSKNICTCLDKIDKTLVSGFAGRDIESERLQKALDGVKAKTIMPLRARRRSLKKPRQVHSRLLA